MALKIKKKKKESSNSLNIFLNKNVKLVKYGFFIAVVVLLLLFLVQPKYVQVKQTQSTMFQDQSSELAGFKEYIQSLEELQTVMVNYQKTYGQNIAKLSELLPTEPQVPNLMAQLEALVQASGFSVTSLNFTESSALNAKAAPAENGTAQATEGSVLALPELDPSVHDLRIAMVIGGGDYFNFKTLLANLEKHLRIIDVSAIAFSGASEETSINLTLNTYYYRPDNL